MKELIPKDEYGVFADMKDTVRADSLYVAEMFEKEHKHVLRDIRLITEPKSGLSEKFIKNNYKQTSYKDSTGRTLPCYAMTRDGFTLLVMGYQGQKAMAFKEAYIKRFNEMEQYISDLKLARLECPDLTQAIVDTHEAPKHYHFSNEMDMINKIVLGMTAKQFRKERNIEEGVSIRPHLTDEQISLVSKLQKVDIGLVLTEPDFQKRKRTLEWYHMKLKQRLAIEEVKGE